MRRALRHPMVVIGGTVMVLWVVTALFSTSIAPYEPLRTSLADRLLPPGRDHWLGTDAFGRDVLSRTLVGSRISLFVGVSTMTIGTVAGTIIGSLAGYYRRLDGLIMRTTDGVMAFPAVMFAIALVAVLGQGVWQTTVALTVVFTPLIIRVAYGEARALSESNFVEAAGGFGAPGPWIIARHLIPNMLPALIVQATYVFAVAVLSEAGLSFVGAGVPPPAPSWGAMTSEARSYMQSAWWILVSPGVAIMSLVLALNLFGDGLRDVLDIRLSEEVAT